MSGFDNMKILVRNEFKRNRKSQNVEKQQQLYFVVNNLAIPKQLAVIGGVN